MKIGISPGICGDCYQRVAAQFRQIPHRLPHGGYPPGLTSPPRAGRMLSSSAVAPPGHRDGLAWPRDLRLDDRLLLHPSIMRSRNGGSRTRAQHLRVGIFLNCYDRRAHLVDWVDAPTAGRPGNAPAAGAAILKMATPTNAELLAMSGPRNPYQGKLEIIEQGAFADLLVIDGNPIDHIELMATPDKNFMIIMKDGKIYKDTLPT